MSAGSLFPWYLEASLYRFGVGPASRPQSHGSTDILTPDQSRWNHPEPRGDDASLSTLSHQNRQVVPLLLTALLRNPLCPPPFTIADNRIHKPPSRPSRTDPYSFNDSPHTSPHSKPPLLANAGSPSCPVLHEGQVANDTRLEIGLLFLGAGMERRLGEGVLTRHE